MERIPTQTQNSVHRLLQIRSLARTLAFRLSAGGPAASKTQNESTKEYAARILRILPIARLQPIDTFTPLNSQEQPESSQSLSTKRHMSPFPKKVRPKAPPPVLKTPSEYRVTNGSFKICFLVRSPALPTLPRNLQRARHGGKYQLDTMHARVQNKKR